MANKKKKNNILLLLFYELVGCACLLVQSVSNLGAIDEVATCNSHSATKQTQCFDIIAANAENLVSHKYEVEKGSSSFKALFNKIKTKSKLNQRYILKFLF